MHYLPIRVDQNGHHHISCPPRCLSLPQQVSRWTVGSSSISRPHLHNQVSTVSYIQAPYARAVGRVGRHTGRCVSNMTVLTVTDCPALRRNFGENL